MLAYREQHLYMEGHPLSRLAAGVSTPFYAYSLSVVRARVDEFRRALPQAWLAFALKANRHPGLLRALAAWGVGADVVSLGEWRAARAAGFPAARLVVNGNAKSDALLRAAVAAGAHSVNLDAAEEIPRLRQAAQSVGRRARVAVRVNPGLDVQTHPHLQVAARGSHFGVPLEDLVSVVRAIQAAPELEWRGLHLHPGSQLLRPEDWHAWGQAARTAAQRLRAAGLTVRQVNWGGGLGITYTEAPDPRAADLAAVLEPYVADLDLETQIFELGRWLVARAGILVVRVVQVKRAWGRRFVAVDGGMNALLRPALYAARHRIWPARRGAPEEPATVVGPNCESADVLASQVPLPADLKPGDLLVVLDTGAYGASMANAYNARPLPQEILVPSLEEDASSAAGSGS